MGMGVADCEFHVLAVDDSLIDRKLIERLLKTSSFQVTTVDSGSKALEFLGWHEHEDGDGDGDGDGERESNSNETSVSPKNHEEVEINLVITDYCMPGMTGYDLLKKMKESSYLRNIPVVIMSSENVPSRITRCLEEGAEEFFLKPVRLSDVNKLRPHMMKTKNNNIIIEKMENDEEEEDDDDSSPSTSTSGIHHLQTTQSLNNNNNGNSKRKSMDEAGLPLDITRPRYNGGLTVLSN